MRLITIKCLNLINSNIYKFHPLLLSKKFCLNKRLNKQFCIFFTSISKGVREKTLYIVTHAQSSLVDAAQHCCGINCDFRR